MALTISQQFAKLVDDSTKVLVVFPKDGSVDHATTALAITNMLRSKGKSVDVCSEGFVLPESLRFLKDANTIQSKLRPLQTFVISLNTASTKADELSYSLKDDILEISVTPKSGAFRPEDISTRSTSYVYQLIITIGAADLVSLGDMYSKHPDFFYSTPKVVIDYSPANERYGTINIIDLVASSCAETTTPFLREFAGTKFDSDVATMLITGMIASTKRFMSPKVTPRTLEIAGLLVGHGARRDEAMQNLYRTRSLGTMKLWGRALARLKYDASARVTWTLLTRSDFVHAGAEAKSLVGVMEELMINTPDADTLVILYEATITNDQQEQVVEALVTSESGAHVAVIKHLSPTTTDNLSVVTLRGMSLLDAEHKILSLFIKP